jgi:hypothetical protein
MGWDGIGAVGVAWRICARRRDAVAIEEQLRQGPKAIRLSDLVLVVAGAVARHQYRHHVEVVVAVSALKDFGGFDDSPITCVRFEVEKTRLSAEDRIF